MRVGDNIYIDELKKVKRTEMIECAQFLTTNNIFSGKQTAAISMFKLVFFPAYFPTYDAAQRYRSEPRCEPTIVFGFLGHGCDALDER